VRGNSLSDQPFLALALRLVRRLSDAKAIIARCEAELGREERISPATRRAVILRCQEVVKRRMHEGRRFDSREIRRYQREITDYLPDTDADTEVALSILPDRARAVLLLHDLEQLALNEVADLLGISVSATRWYLHRSRRLVRIHLYRDAQSHENSSDRQPAQQPHRRRFTGTAADAI
jgi:hypothetical protein